MTHDEDPGTVSAAAREGDEFDRLSKKDLVERAAALGIEGHLSMSRAELSEALRRA